MSTITKDQAQKIIEAADEVITALAGTNEDIHPDNYTKMCEAWNFLNDNAAPPEVVRELARIALASLEAEAYGYVHKAAYEQAGSCGLSSDHEAYRDSPTHIAVYTVPPAPVSVPDGYRLQPISEYDAMCAAMLQGADGNSPVIPDGWVLVPAEPTEAMMNAWLSEVANWRGHAAGYRAMIAAAPQQEVK